MQPDQKSLILGAIDRALTFDHPSLLAAHRSSAFLPAAYQGTRSTQMQGVISTLEDMAARRQLIASRIPALWLTLQRNLEFGRKHKITGTPTLLFTNGNRVPGAIGAAELEKQLAAAAK